jgi:hypothetical protein
MNDESRKMNDESRTLNRHDTDCGLNVWRAGLNRVGLFALLGWLEAYFNSCKELLRLKH